MFSIICRPSLADAPSKTQQIHQADIDAGVLVTAIGISSVDTQGSSDNVYVTTVTTLSRINRILLGEFVVFTFVAAEGRTVPLALKKDAAPRQTRH